jgi:hypothetical protein
MRGRSQCPFPVKLLGEKSVTFTSRRAGLQFLRNGSKSIR